MSVERYQGRAWIDCDVCGTETDSVPFMTGADPERPTFATDPEPGAIALGWEKIGREWRCPACKLTERASESSASCHDIACPDCGELIPSGTCCHDMVDAWAAGEDTSPYENFDPVIRVCAAPQSAGKERAG